MNDEAADRPDTPEDLPVIEFQSPGRFAVHNPATSQPETECWEPAPFRLGETTELQRFSSVAQLRMHVIALLQQARRSVCIYTPDLEPWLYDHASVQQALSQLLLAHPRNQVRILVQDSSRAVRDGHRLLHLTKRISSNLHLRKLNPETPSPDSASLIADDSGLLLRNLSERFSGVAHYNSPSRVRQQQEAFERAWATGLFDADLRSLLI